MVYVIIVLLIFFSVFLWVFDKGLNGFFISILAALGVTISGGYITVVILSAFFTTIFENTNCITYQEKYIREICQLKDKYYVSCRKHSENGLEYIYLYEDNDCYKTDTIDTDSDVEIYAYDKLTPRVVCEEAVFNNEILEKLFVKPLKKDKYEIYAPEGTINFEYNIDLE